MCQKMSALNFPNNFLDTHKSLLLEVCTLNSINILLYNLACTTFYAEKYSHINPLSVRVGVCEEICRHHHYYLQCLGGLWPSLGFVKIFYGWGW